MPKDYIVVQCEKCHRYMALPSRLKTHQCHCGNRVKMIEKKKFYVGLMHLAITKSKQLNMSEGMKKAGQVSYEGDLFDVWRKKLV